ncbi:MAG TPA: DUF3122 domain-containing protein [Crinalium sp.]|jgi:hypothetical protein
MTKLRIFQWLWPVLQVCILGCILILGSVQPALASIHPYPEGDEQVMWRSLQTLRDTSDRAWQTVLYKRVRRGEVTDLHLRLVGFPNAVDLVHPQPLSIRSGMGNEWAVPDVSDTAPMAPHIGEYDLKDFWHHLNSDTALRLTLTQRDGTAIALPIPPFAVREWRQLVDRQ